jgi:hypothetical protein
LISLSKSSPKNLERWLQEGNRNRLLEAFTIEDIVTLAYARWTGKFQQLPAPTTTAFTPSTNRPKPLGEVVLNQAGCLLPSMQLKLVISDNFSIIGNRGVLQQRSPFIHEAPVDEDEPIPTMYLPFASSLPQGEVLEFFAMTDNGHLTRETAWKVSWVQLADYLQMADVLDEAAKWV